MKELSFEKMEGIKGGGFWSCIGGSALAVGVFVAGAALAPVTAGGAIVAVIGLYGGIGFGCFTK